MAVGIHRYQQQESGLRKLIQTIIYIAARNRRVLPFPTVQSKPNQSQTEKVMKMAAEIPPVLTMSHDGISGDREFVVACKGRPFAILTSPNFPTPAATLVDYNLVRDLKLQMSDLQCSKFTYGGQKLRILGKVSSSVQCILDGNQAGNMHFKATVVQDLYSTFNTHSIAGKKLSEKLIGPPYKLLPPEESTTEPTTPKRKKKKKSSQTLSSPCSDISRAASTPMNDSLANSSQTPSPHGSPLVIPALSPIPPPANPQGSPRTVNIARLTCAFGNADEMDDTAEEAEYLAQVYPDGQMFGCDGDSFTFAMPRNPRIDRTLNHALVYRSGHGRDSCHIGCEDAQYPPHNCGYHPQWNLPQWFQICGETCRRGLCDCLGGYGDNYGYYG